MATLTIDNPIPTPAKNVKSYLTSAVSTAATTLAVANTEGYTVNRYVQIGETGSEQTELKLLSAIGSTTSLTTAALSFGHSAQTPVYEMRYNQFRIYRTRLGSTSLLMTINIQAGGFQTVYTDTGTLTGDTYSVSYYNATTGDETPTTGQVATTGAASNSLYSLRTRFRNKWQDSTKRFSDDILNSFANEIIRDMYYAAQEEDQNYGLVGPVTNTTGTDLSDGTGTTFAIDATTRIYKWLFVSYNGGSYKTKAYLEDIRNFDPNHTYNQSYPTYTFTGSQIIIRPSGCTGISYYHYPILTELSADTDLPPAPLSSFADVIIEGMLWIAAETPAGNLEVAATKKRNYMEGRAKFLRSITDRQLIEPNAIELIDTRMLATTDDLQITSDYGRI